MHYEFQFKIDEMYFLHQIGNNINLFIQSHTLSMTLNKMLTDTSQIILTLS